MAEGALSQRCHQLANAIRASHPNLPPVGPLDIGHR